jgi:hypothetical protein
MLLLEPKSECNTPETGPVQFRRVGGCVYPLTGEDEKWTTYYHGEKKFFRRTTVLRDKPDAPKNVLPSKLDSLK